MAYTNVKVIHHISTENGKTVKDKYEIQRVFADGGGYLDGVTLSIEEIEQLKILINKEDYGTK